MRIIFARHGETALTPKGILHKVDDEAGLTEQGREQVKNLCKALKNCGAEIIYSSPEKRALETSEMIADEFKIKTRILPEFRERNWGELVGLAWTDVEKELRVMGLEKRYTFIPPKGESWKQVEDRLKRGLKLIANSGYKIIIVVTHGGVLRTLMPILTLAPLDSSFQYNFHSCSITIFDWNGEKFSEVVINGVVYL